MKNKDTNDNEKRIQHTFDSYCKKVLKNEAINISNENKRKQKNLVFFSELTEKEKSQLFIQDEYLTNQYLFCVFGDIIRIKADNISKALFELPQLKRNIILASYVLDMTDQAIADEMNISRSIVQYHRTKTLGILKGKMEGVVHE